MSRKDGLLTGLLVLWAFLVGMAERIAAFCVCYVVVLYGWREDDE